MKKYEDFNWTEDDFDEEESPHNEFNVDDIVWFKCIKKEGDGLINWIADDRRGHELNGIQHGSINPGIEYFKNGGLITNIFHTYMKITDSDVYMVTYHDDKGNSVTLGFKKEELEHD